ncbi:MAG TPA: GAF and ANTAR domain-containing protein [Nocardioides sp.]|uniref:GAF and ANTAR domain-containing protein n=1 Tax=Nocardioides sp. TaxID=35761 RepID=UPI002E34F392|nr:GAF and ANTAR domain-containing protein [Nocardioides sp.]HEX3930762.1 GAF and ANTAR domain-containing protein [Nocardioides sp.]
MRDAALESLTISAVANIPGVDFASVTLRHADQSIETIAATDALAEQTDSIQYKLREGPCYAAVTTDRLVLVNDVATSPDFPRYGPSAAGLGVGSQVAIQLLHDGEQAGLNLYAYQTDVFDRSTIQLAELFATQAGAVLEYAVQVEQLSEALHTRTDIGISIGILMERYGIDRNQAFAFLVRSSQDRNIKIRVLAHQLIDGTFASLS